MEIYSTEEQQVEAIKGWWHEHGTQVIVGAVIGLASIWGWRAWSDYQLAQQEQASAEYTQVAEQSVNDQDIAALSAFAEAQGESGYGALASLLAAQQAADAGELAQAAEYLTKARAVLNDPAIEPLIRQRLARVMAAQGELDQAMALASEPVSEAWIGRFAELRGDLLLQQGEREQAREAYQQALTAQPDNQLLEIKLADLATL